MLCSFFTPISILLFWASCFGQVPTLKARQYGTPAAITEHGICTHFWKMHEQFENCPKTNEIEIVKRRCIREYIQSLESFQLKIDRTKRQQCRENLRSRWDLLKGIRVYSAQSNYSMYSHSMIRKVAPATVMCDIFTSEIFLEKDSFETSIEYDNSPDTPRGGWFSDIVTNYFTGLSPMLSISAFKTNGSLSRVPAQVEFAIDVSRDSMPSTGGGVYIKEIRYICGFVNATTGKISRRGCEVAKYTTGCNVTCKCNHTTAFVVMLSVRTVEIPNGVKITSYVMLSTSVVFLLTALCLLIHIRASVNQERVLIQISLLFSLISLHTLNLFSELALNSNEACSVVAVLTHYFLLTTVMWMLMEGITLALKTTDAVLRYSESSKWRSRALYGLCWVSPAIFVSSASIVGFTQNSYLVKNPVYKEQIARNDSTYISVGMYEICWINPTSSIFIPTVIAPVSFALFVNFLVMFRLIYVVYKMSLKAQNFRPMAERFRPGEKGFIKTSHLKAALKFAIMLMPVIGFPWIIGFFFAVRERLAVEVVMYLNAIINGSQGVFIFFLYCVISSEARTALQRKWKQRVESKELARNSVRRMYFRGKKELVSGVLVTEEIQ